jgi:hypothetical protein
MATFFAAAISAVFELGAADTVWIDKRRQPAAAYLTNDLQPSTAKSLRLN